MPASAMPSMLPNEDGGRDPRPARSRSLLIEAATRLLADGGVDAVTIDAVTRLAGVSRATLYRHFGAGTELLAAAFERLIPPVPEVPASGTFRDRLLGLLIAQARLIEHAPLHVTVLAWLGMSQAGAAIGDEGGDDRPRLRALRRRIIEQYRSPFDAILGGDDAPAALRDRTDYDVMLAQLAGPLIFNRLITEQPIDEAFCGWVVDDFLSAHAAR